jgi:hypothetical protein
MTTNTTTTRDQIASCGSSSRQDIPQGPVPAPSPPKGGVPRPAPQPPQSAGGTAKLVIELELRGHSDDAFRVVDNVLDSGAVQDAINGAAGDLGIPVSVISAVAVLVERRRT